jgi:pyridoxine/pyridoxamine 5'-phosphate oxidase
MTRNLHDQRREYASSPFDESALSENSFEQFQTWYQAAAASQMLEPNAMV